MKLFLVAISSYSLPYVQPLKFLANDANPVDTPLGSTAKEMKEMLDRFRAADERYGYVLANTSSRDLSEGMLPPLSADSSFSPGLGVGGDPAMAIAAGTGGGGDYFTKRFTSENIADPKRGSGGCTAWRATLQCNPSGIRDPLNDKDCEKVIPAESSGFCECGEYAQFAAVDCNHRPFTCETMCLKFALISHKQAYYKGKALSPQEAEDTVKYLMWANQTDLESMRVMTNELVGFMNRAMQYSTESGNLAKDSLRKFEEKMKVVRQHDAQKAAEEMAKVRAQLAEGPWLGIWRSGQDMVRAGQGIQNVVKSALPFKPQEAMKLKMVS